MELSVYKSDGSDSGRKIVLNEAVFGIEPNNNAMFEHAREYLANRRQGTHETKGRSQVHGSSRKLFKQKGTGGARRGNLRSPLLKGGGTMHGPHPRDYGFKVNKRVSILARKSAYSAKAGVNALMVVEDFTFQSPSTREMKNVLAALNLSGKKVLFLVPSTDSNIHVSARNLETTRVLEAANATTYQILDADIVVLQEGAVGVVEKVLTRPITRGASV